MLGYRWLIIVMALFLSGVVHSEEAPAGPDVCDAMTSAGEDLRAGSLSSFYFVEGLGAEFPVPKFMKAVPVYDFSGIQVEASEFPGFPPAGIAQRMRLEANRCGWMLSIRFGERGDFEDYFGAEGVSELGVEHRLGGLRVWISDGPVLEGSPSFYRVVALNDEGFARFLTDSVDNAVWLLELFVGLKQVE